MTIAHRSKGNGGPSPRRFRGVIRLGERLTRAGIARKREAERRRWRESMSRMGDL